VSSHIWNDAFKSIQQRGLGWQLVTRAGHDYTNKQTVLDVAVLLGSNVSGLVQLRLIKLHPSPERLDSPLLAEV